MSPSAGKAKSRARTGAAASAPSGLFIGAWRIGTMLVGAPEFTVHLTFTAPAGTCAGLGQITQPVSPPLAITSRVEGDYTYLTVMPDTSHILVTLTGYPMINWPSHGGVGPVILPNLQVRMILGSDWQSGTASFQYLGPDGAWQRVESATAERLDDVQTAGKP